jgi:hypothetical protein
LRGRLPACFLQGCNDGVTIGRATKNLIGLRSDSAARRPEALGVAFSFGGEPDCSIAILDEAIRRYKAAPTGTPR